MTEDLRRTADAKGRHALNLQNQASTYPLNASLNREAAAAVADAADAQNAYQVAQCDLDKQDSERRFAATLSSAVGTVMTSLVDKLHAGAPRAPPRATTGGDEVHRALLLQRLKKGPAMGPGELRDLPSLFAALRWAEQLAPRTGGSHGVADFTQARFALLASTTDETMTRLVESTGHTAPCTTTQWRQLCASLLGALTPRAIEEADASILKATNRVPRETLREYYGRADTAFTLAVWVRAVLGRDHDAQWLAPHLRAWAKGLNEPALTAAVITMSDTATLHDYLMAVERASSMLPPGQKINMMHTDRVNMLASPPASVIQPDFGSLTEAMEGAIGRLNNMGQFQDGPRPAWVPPHGSPGKRQKRNHVLGTGSGQQERRPMLCYNCSEMGHIAAECTAACGFCKEAGHTSHTCAKRLAARPVTRAAPNAVTATVTKKG